MWQYLKGLPTQFISSPIDKQVDMAKSITLALSIILGGGWTLFQFNSLLSTQIASTELEKSKLLIEKTSLENESIRSELIPMINLDLRSDLYKDSDQKRWLAVEIQIENKGKFGTTLDISLEPCRIARVLSSDGTGSVHVGPIKHTGKLKLRSSEEQNDSSGETANVSHITVHSGRSTTLPFIFEIHEEGIYYVEFRAKLSPDSVDRWIQNGAPPDRTMNWAISKYVNVSFPESAQFSPPASP